ncbi:MAG: SRPBCC family protein [Bacteroidales bacterium]|nr:SRPBCC family protein [Bacteroidales bacterium]
MSKFESEIKTIGTNITTVYAKLSDLSNLEKVKDKIPQDKLKDIEFDSDSFRFSVDPVGKIGLRIIEKEEPKTIKFKSELAPIDFFVWIQLKESAENETKAKLTLEADLNPFIKGMVSKPLQEAIDKLANLIAGFPY